MLMLDLGLEGSNESCEERLVRDERKEKAEKVSRSIIQRERRIPTVQSLNIYMIQTMCFVAKKLIIRQVCR
jgi:hypothetical protein